MFHIVTTYLSSTLILLSGLFMMMLKVPVKEEWRYLRITRIFIFISYTILAVAGIGSVLYEFRYGTIPDRRPMILSVAFWQALLFTYTSVTFIQPRFLTWKKALTGIAVVLPFVILSALGDTFGAGARTGTVVAYIAFMAGCIWVFRREFHKGLRQLEKHYEEEFAMRMRWVSGIFYGALGIGMLAIFYSVYNTRLFLFDLFTVTHTAFYIYVVNRIRLCLLNETFLEDVAVAVQQKKRIEDQTAEVAEDESPLQEGRIGEAIRQWVDQEKYLQRDKSIDEVADEMQVTHDELNEWCTRHYGLLFRSWRMKLRIEKAKQLLLENPDVKIVELQERTGFSDKSHFFKQFKQITGMTPTEFRKSAGKK